jgi:type I restriction enzyme S subunit
MVVKMNKLEKYSSYKDSGVEWLGEIPEHWETQKMKYLGKMFAGLTDKKGDDFSKEFSEDKKPFIPFTNVCNNVKIDSNQMQYVNVKPYEKQNKVQKNDIIFLMSSETLDDIGKCSIHLDDEQFYLNSFCKGFRPKKSSINPEFLNYLLQSKTYRNYFALVGRGFTRINIKQEYINDLFTVLPKEEEQTKIASFLDKKTAQIDSAISQKEKLIELLKEQKQITINKAVTKGLNQNVEFKDSGVEWITKETPDGRFGEIPKHWEVEKVKYIFKDSSIKNFGNETPLAATQLYGVVPKDTLDYRTVEANVSDLNTFKLVKENNFVISLRSFEGGIEYSAHRGIISPAYTVMEALQDIGYKYFKYLFKSNIFIQALNIYKTGIREGQNISFVKFKDDFIPLPPIEEQEDIAQYLDKQTVKIDKAIKLQQNYITKLKEYKVTLIDSIVTGKVKV